MKQDNEPRKRGKTGRIPKNDKADHCVMVRFTDVEQARFLSLFEQSGVAAKAVFVKARVFSEPFHVVKTDRATLEYVTKLTTFHGQFRFVGTNYNQVVKELHTHFSEKKALELLYKLEKATIELARIGQSILELSRKFESEWLQK